MRVFRFDNFVVEIQHLGKDKFLDIWILLLTWKNIDYMYDKLNFAKYTWVIMNLSIRNSFFFKKKPSVLNQKEIFNYLWKTYKWSATSFIYLFWKK